MNFLLKWMFMQISIPRCLAVYGLLLSSIGVAAFAEVVSSESPAGATPSGLVWTTPATLSGSWKGVTYGNGTFAAVANDDSVSSSTDGSSWRTPSSIQGSWRGGWNGITFGNGTFVAVAWHYAAISVDGILWSWNQIPEALQGVAFGNGMFVAVSQYQEVTTSSDGITWSSPSALNGQWDSVVYGDGKFVAVAGDGKVATSTDGATWTTPILLPGAWSSITFGAGQFVAVGNDGSVASSTDGATWTTPILLPGAWSSITFGAGQFVTVGTDGSVASSTDGATWTTPVTLTTGWSSVTYGAGQFVAVGSGWTVTAPWSAPSSPTSVKVKPGVGQATVSWKAPSGSIAPAITRYTATASPGGADCTSATTTCVIHGLASGIRYSISVMATNRVGTSDPTIAVSVTLAAPPVTLGPTVSSTTEVTGTNLAATGFTANVPMEMAGILLGFGGTALVGARRRRQRV